MIANIVLGLIFGVMLVFTIGVVFLASEEKEQRYRSHE